MIQANALDSNANSALNFKVNTQVKLLLACVFFICVFVCKNWPTILIYTAILLIINLTSKVKFSHLVKIFIPIVFILLFTIVIQSISINIEIDSLRYQNSCGYLALNQNLCLFGNFYLTLDGFICGCFFALRIALVTFAFAYVSYTSSNVEIRDAIVRFCMPLKKLGVPIDNFAMIMTLAIRFIPIIENEIKQAYAAQICRLGQFKAKGLKRKVMAYGKLVNPVAMHLVSYCDDLSCAMECRCYSTQTRRSSYFQKWDVADFIILLLLCVLMIGVCVFYG
ncbi:MAG: energy-coupling factor transporter transmembrane protein EcfT [Coriobacteriales bacterium]|nr:energy-coupling factor transporter transmembrane protein EcfT [Coriobacteriales bacterium]